MQRSVSEDNKSFICLSLICKVILNSEHSATWHVKHTGHCVRVSYNLIACKPVNTISTLIDWFGERKPAGTA